MVKREPRYPTHSSIILTARGLGRHFVVKNVSKSGAGLVGDKALRVGEPVTLNLRDGRVDGTVRWATDHKAGIVFKDRLDDYVFKSLLSVASHFNSAQSRIN